MLKHEFCTEMSSTRLNRCNLKNWINILHNMILSYPESISVTDVCYFYTLFQSDFMYQNKDKIYFIYLNVSFFTSKHTIYIKQHIKCTHENIFMQTNQLVPTYLCFLMCQ